MGPDGQVGTRLGPRSVELAQAEEVGSWSAWRWMRCPDGDRSMTAAPVSIVRNLSVELSSSFRHWAPRPDAGGPLVGDSRWWLLDFSAMTGEEENSLKCHNKLSTMLRQAAVCCRAFKV